MRLPTFATPSSRPRSSAGEPPALLLLALLFLCVLGCETKSAPVDPAPAPEATAPQRIVSLAPSVTETLYALGAGDRVVGVTRFCDYPPEAAQKPKIGGLTDVDVEMVLSLEPDLVLGVQTQTAASLQRTMTAAQIETRFVPTETLADVTASIETLGELVGNRAGAEKIVRDIEAERVTPSDTPPRVLVLFGREPWIGAGPGTFADEMIRATGGVNALADMDVPYPSLDAERLGAVAPDLVLDTSFGDAVADVPGAGRTVRLDPALIRPGPRLVEAMKLFAANIAEARR